MSICSDQIPLHDTACGRSLDDHMDMVSDLLPQGRAWPRDPDSTLMKYWRAFADVIKFAEDRICSLANEFYCSTFSETTEIWTEQYLGVVPNDPSSIDAACLKPRATSATDYNALVCAKMIEQGGSECSYFTDYARALGWVISCEDVSEMQVAMAGCWNVGCGMLPVPPERQTTAGTVGCSPLGVAYSGPAPDHPYPEFFDAASRQSAVPCGMIGSNLGVGALGGDCCHFAGYYAHPASNFATAAVSGGPCTPGIDATRYIDTGFAGDSLPHCDTSGDFKPVFGFAHHWKIAVDVPASLQVQQDSSNIATLWSPAGCMYCGDTCGPLRGAGLDALWEAIEDVKPAHTVLVREAIWT